MPTMPVPTATIETVAREVQMWQAGFTRADAVTPAELRCLFRPLDNDGQWDPHAGVKRFHAVDDPTRESEPARTVATDIRAAMLAAIVPECDAVTRLEEVTGLALAGLSFQAVGEALIPRLLQLGLLTQE